MRNFISTFLLISSFGFFCYAESQTVAQSSPGTFDHSPPGAPPTTKERIKSGAGAVKMAQVFFTNVKDGDTVGQTITLKFAVNGMKIKPAGEIEPGTGHFHVLIDSPIVKEGEVVPANEKNLHFGKGQTEANITLTPGKHTLVLQFADGAHRAFGKELSQEIHVTAK